ncbi:MAG: hypothetical protein QGF59_29105, partial [Pirellulaceae bacterium]|nr:hypothetical protein [Pirellulaceae bacterium]
EALPVKLGYRVTGTYLNPVTLLANTITTEGIYHGNQANGHDRRQENPARHRPFRHDRGSARSQGDDRRSGT